MKSTATVLQEEGNQLVSRLAELFVKHDINATGETSRGIYAQSSPNRLQVMAPGQIDEVLDGSGPGTKPELSALDKWRKARNLAFAPEALQGRIQSVGTRLWRGVDPRYPGKRSRRFVVAEAFTPSFLEKLKARYQSAATSTFIQSLKK